MQLSSAQCLVPDEVGEVTQRAHGGDPVVRSLVFLWEEIKRKKNYPTGQTYNYSGKLFP